MYTQPVARAPDLRAAPFGANQWDLLTPLGIAPPDPARDAVEMVRRRQRRPPRADAPLRAAGIGPNAAGRDSRQRRQPVPPLARRLVRRPSPRRWCGATRARRILLTSGPSDAAAAGRSRGRARERSASWPRGARPGRLRSRTSCARSSRARRSTLAATADRCTSPRRRARPIVALLGPTLPERSTPWRDPRWFIEIVDAASCPAARAISGMRAGRLPLPDRHHRRAGRSHAAERGHGRRSEHRG